MSRLYRLCCEVDRKSKRHGGELVADVLKSHGVCTVFTLVGGHVSPILTACEQRGIAVVDTRHEATAVFAADAYARLRKAPVGVAIVTAGPGVTNTVTAMKNSAMAESPVLLLGGASATILKGRGALQDIEQLSLFASICKHSLTVSRVADIIPTLRRAIATAHSGTPGPVFVELPVDVLYPYHVVAKETLPKRQSSALSAQILKLYLQTYLANVFAAAWKPRSVQPLRVKTTRAAASQLAQCKKLLSQCERPVVLVGSQAVGGPAAPEEVGAALQRLSLPCYLAGMARGLLGAGSCLQLRHKRREALKEADLILLVGVSCDFRLSYGRILPRRAKVIAVNRDRRSLYLNSDAFWTPRLAIAAEPGTFLLQLAQSLPPAAAVSLAMDASWIPRLRSRDQERDDEIMQRALMECRGIMTTPQDAAASLISADGMGKPDSPDGEVSTPIYGQERKMQNPMRMIQLAQEVMGDKAVVVVDGGDFVATAAYILRPKAPLRWLDPGAFGTLGVGGGFALGVSRSMPDAEVWLFYGDGSLGFSLAEFDTFVRYRVPVIAVVGNDASWAQIAREQVPMLQSSVACNLAHSEYEVAARGLGAEGIRIGPDCSEEDARSRFAEAQSLARSGRPVLVNCIIGKSDFREGSISV